MNKPTVLIVEDEPGLRRALAAALRGTGTYDVVQAEDGVAAQEVLRARPIDVVVTDVVMPRLDGIGLLEWASRHCPGPAWLILSGLDTLDVAVKALQLGAFDFVTKPVASVDALTTVVRNALAQKRLEAERERLRREVEATNAALRRHVAGLEEAYGLLRAQAETIEQDLRRAERIQRALLPRSAPPMAGVVAEALYRPSHLVGGDSYDIQGIDDDHVAVYVADSAGHGVSAAMLSVLLKQRIALRDGRAPRRPAEVLAALNRDLLFECDASGLFVTAACLLIDTRRRTALFASAGHPRALHVRPNGEWTALDRTGPALGLTAEATYDERQIDLREGDRLLVYTDGLSWGRADAGAIERRLAGALAQAAPPAAGALLPGILEALTREEGGAPPADDVTMVLLSTGDASSHLDNGEHSPARPAPEGAGAVLTTGTRDGETWIAVRGSGTWTQCASLQEVCTAALGGGGRLAFDLAACAYLDSTFLGTLHHLVCAAGGDAARVRLVRVPPAVRGLFEELAMDQVTARITDVDPPAPASMTSLAASRGDRSREVILHAHELLASLSADNERQFGDLVDALRSEAAGG
jgi:serine phosphatase RsbU (regulator of sigma subunit)/anti-anti-sigma regulatory factor